MSATEILHFRPPQLAEGKEWYVYLHAKHPTTGEMKRKRYKLNHIKSITERRRYAKKLIEELTNKLYQGWNPWVNVSGQQLSTWSKVTTNYLRIVAKEHRPDTLRAYTSVLKVTGEYFMNVRQLPAPLQMQHITAQLMGELFNHLYIERNVSERTFNNYLLCLRTFFLWCVNNGYMTADPVANIKKKHAAKKEQVFISEPERQALRAVLKDDNPMLLTMCQLIFYCLIRRTEMTRLKVQHIDLQNGLIHLPGTISKNKKSQAVTMPKQLIREIAEYLGAGQYTEDMYLFGVGGCPGRVAVKPKWISTQFAKYAKKANLPNNATFYALKTTGAVVMARQGIDIDEIRKQGRWSDLNIPAQYMNYRYKVLPGVRNSNADF